LNSKHPKPGGGKSHPQPHQGGAQHNKCDVSGSIDVRGVIEAKLPPDLQKERDTAEEKKETRDRRRYVIEILTLIFVIIYAGLTGWYAWVAYRQWKDLRHNFETDERAWIALSFSFTPDEDFRVGDSMTPGKMFDGKVTARYENSGKTPILESESHIWVEILDHDAAPSLSLTGKHLIATSGFIFPSKFEQFHARRHHDDGSEFPPTDAELADLRSGKDYVAVYGYVVYVDDFGSHWEKFCQWWHYIDPSDPLTFMQYPNTLPCTSFNKIGEGDSPLADTRPGK
jgi:hypothetical protein